MSDRVREILSWYGSDNPGTRANLARLLTHGTLGGTGRLVILPVDQGFEHGPARSFAPNPPGYHPHYHFELAIDAGCNAYAAPLGFIEAGAAEFAGRIPLILKLNNHDLLHDDKDPLPSVTGSVRDALRLGCAAVGYTIYPGSAHCTTMYQQLREISEEAKAHGLAVVVWSYPRGSQLSKEGETGVDVVAYAAQIACQLGAHVVKVKLPTAHLEQAAAKKVYEFLRRAADRDLLGRTQERGQGLLRRGPGDPRRRRLRLDHRPQLLPAAQGRGPEVPADRDGHLRGRDSVAAADGQ
jgi:class I fructose-bisphosphate aldolase